MGVAEGVVVLGVDGSHQSQHRLLVFLVDVLVVHLFGFVVRLAQHRLEDLDAVFAAVLHVVHRHVGVVHQLPAGGRVKGRGADADAQGQHLQLVVHGTAVHVEHLIPDGLRQSTGGQHVVTGQQPL